MNPKRTGKALAVLFFAGFLAEPSSAALFASMDRYRIAMGDTVRLTLRSDDERDPADADLRGLQEHFEVLQRSSSVSTRIVNGERSQNRELVLELTPRRQGSIVVPPFVVDGIRSEALAVEIAPEPQASSSDEIATFEALLDRSSPYVQGQLLLTLRVQQAVNLESRSITELEVDNAYVEALGQNSFQRTIDGRPWLVHEIRYAIFPESSGELVIPAQTFSGRLGAGRRTLFDTRPAGRLIRRQTDELRVNVRPRPAAYPAGTWLPAADLRIEEQWSAPLDQLQVGDSITRTVTVTGDGLQGAQLPPIDSNAVPGLRIYPDQPTINNVTSDSGITGLRSDSVALVAVSDGGYELPAIEIPWWDTGSDTLRMARLPARRIKVLPPPVTEVPGEEAMEGDASQPIAASGAAMGSNPWPWIAGICAAGWLLSTVLLLRRRRAPEPPSGSAPKTTSSPRELLKACDRNDPGAAREAFTAWVRGLSPDTTTGEWLQRHGSEELRQAVANLDQAIYGPAATGSWDGQVLANAVRNQSSEGDRASSGTALPDLYLSGS